MDEVLRLLDSLGISYTNHLHKAVFTCEESSGLDEDIKGARSKNLFIKGRTTGKYYLVILECAKRANLKRLQDTLDEKKISFASPEELFNILNLTPGSVTPFGLIHDVDHKVEVIIDREFWDHDAFTFHPNINTATLEITKSDFEKFLTYQGSKYRIVCLP